MRFSFESKLTAESDLALLMMSIDDKIKFVKAIVEARNSASPDSEKGRESITLLTKHFGEGVRDHKAFRDRERLMYTLDSDGIVFRCWYASFGTVARFGGRHNHYHFDSCGEGLLFHVSSADDRPSLRNFASALTEGMLEWRSKCGTMWAGLDRD